MDRSALKEIILDQEKREYNKPLIERDIFKRAESHAKDPFIIVISGIRRVGKSTLLQQIREKHPGYFLNFDDERLVPFTVADFQQVCEIFIELFGKKDFFYFDEIQNIPQWERFVRRLHDEGKKVFVTGSNASMLSKELGTHLTGRYLELTLYPFSFSEFLKFKKFVLEKHAFYSAEGRVELKKYFDEYILQGGFPEYLETQNADYLRLLYENILFRDIMARYKLPSEKRLHEFVYLITTNIAKEMSFNSIKKTLLMGSPTTVKEYLHYLENSFLLFLVNKFDYSIKKQLYANKKGYSIDTALAIHLGFRSSRDIGKLLENLIFIELKRREKEIYFYAGKNECDFVLKKGDKITQAIQVCYEIHEGNKQREINGLLETMAELKCEEGIILTHEQTEEIIVEKKNIQMIPAWKWLLQ